MIVVERYDNRDVGFMTAACWTALGELQDMAAVIPVTARVQRQYDRIRFPRSPRIAVVEAGSRILVDGTPNREWDERTARLVRDAGATPTEVSARMARLELTEPVRTGDVALVYARVAGNAEISDFAHWCTRHGWNAVAQDGRIYVLPDGIDKGPAAVEAARLASGVIVAAAGDGLMDEAMLRAAPLALTPEHGPLWSSGRRFATAIAGYGPESAERIVLAAVAAISQKQAVPTGTQQQAVPAGAQGSTK